MKMTVSVATLLLLLIVSVSVRKSRGEVWPLDMAENSVDDSFKGCENRMHDLVMTNYIEREKQNTPGFREAWNNAINTCNNGGFRDLGAFQCAAIYMYTQDPSDNPQCSHVKFNNACRAGKEAYKSNDFQFYTLYYFLTDAVQKLKKQLLQSQQCVTSYRRTKVTFAKVTVNQTIRFGSFTSSSLSMNFTHFGKESCFKIETCYGANVQNYSALSYEQEVLIPPYEVFRIKAIKKQDKKNKNLWCKVVYKLESAGERSDLRCAKTKIPSVWGL